MAAADTAIAIGISAAFGRFRNITTVSQTMNFMRAIPAGDVAIEVVVRKLGRSLVFAEASFRAGGSRAIAAQAVATWAVIP
jgi:acyl-coenzyme A thioesterase PaaI-like protein